MKVKKHSNNLYKLKSSKKICKKKFLETFQNINLNEIEIIFCEAI